VAAVEQASGGGGNPNVQFARAQALASGGLVEEGFRHCSSGQAVGPDLRPDQLGGGGRVSLEPKGHSCFGARCRRAPLRQCLDWVNAFSSARGSLDG